MTKEFKKDIIQWDIKAWSKALSYWDNNIEWDKVQTDLNLADEKVDFHYGSH